MSGEEDTRIRPKIQIRLRWLLLAPAVLLAGLAIGYVASPRIRGEVRFVVWRAFGGSGPFRCGHHSSDFKPAMAFTLSGKTIDRPGGRAIEVGEGCVITLEDSTVRGAVGIFIEEEQFFIQGPRVRVHGGSVEGSEASFLFGEKPEHAPPEISANATITGPVMGGTVIVRDDPDTEKRLEEIARKRKQWAREACRQELLACLDAAHISGEVDIPVRLHFDATGNGDSALTTSTLEPAALARCFTGIARKTKLDGFAGGPGSVICRISGIALRGGTGTASVSEVDWAPD